MLPSARREAGYPLIGHISALGIMFVRQHCRHLGGIPHSNSSAIYCAFFVKFAPGAPMAKSDIKKVVLANSGGLDTSVIV
jgi:hypothetical protein